MHAGVSLDDQVSCGMLLEMGEIPTRVNRRDKDNKDTRSYTQTNKEGAVKDNSSNGPTLLRPLQARRQASASDLYDISALIILWLMPSVFTVLGCL